MDSDQDIRASEAERWWQYFRDSLLFSKEYGFSTIKSLILINGGALIALLSFLAASDVRENLSEISSINYLYSCFFCYVAGLLLSIVAGGAGYFNFQFAALTLPFPDELSEFVRTGNKGAWLRHKGIGITAIIGAAAAILSGLSFSLGCWFALKMVIGAFE